MNKEEYFIKTMYHKTPKYSKEQLLTMYWSGHPRFRFFKSPPLDASFLDIGAGNGGAAFWKTWKAPERSDLKLYGIDLTIGEYADMYERFDKLDLDIDPLPYENNFFDAIYSTHVLEHLRFPQKVINELCRVLQPGGICYIEVPNHNTVNVPSKDEFLAQGFITSTMNFYDDKTHLSPYSSYEIVKLLGKQFEVLEMGSIQNPYLSELLTAYGYQYRDQEITTYGLWLRTNWCDYVWARKKNRELNELEHRVKDSI